MQLNTNIDLVNKVMTYTHLSFGSDGNYVSQIVKKIKYKVTLTPEEGSRVFYAWSAQTCAQTLRDNKRDFSYQDVYSLFDDVRHPEHRNRVRLKGAIVEKL
jgi:hypothetical protein